MFTNVGINLYGVEIKFVDMPVCVKLYKDAAVEVVFVSRRSLSLKSFQISHTHHKKTSLGLPENASPLSVN